MVARLPLGMDAFVLIAAERRRLADELELLSPEEWATPSLCGAWSAHEVAAHLIVPFTVGLPQIALGMVRALGSFDRANERFARDVAAARPPAECVAILRANAEHRFTPPMLGPEAPLTDVVTHGGDLLAPLGRSVAVVPEAYEVALRFATERRIGFAGIDVSDLRLEADDVEVAVGDDGPTVTGPARSLLGTVQGRVAYLDDLGGEGADELRRRALARAGAVDGR